MAAEPEMTQTGVKQHIYYISSSKNNKNHINRPPSFLILHEKPVDTEPAKDHGKSPQVVLTYEHFFRVYLCETEK